MKPTLPKALLLGAVFAFAQSGAALGCACCTNTGQRYVENTRLRDYQRAIINEVRFAKEANLFVDERNLADIKGIAGPSETYVFSVTQQKNRLVFFLP